LTNNPEGLQSYPKVAVVILNWNGRKHLQHFLPFLQQSTYPNMSLIVADNGSTDDSVSFLEMNYPEVEILRSPINEGYAKGYNTALKKVTAEYCVLLNSDVEVTPGWIEPVIELMESDKFIAACQPKILMWADKNRFEYAGAAGGYIDRYGYPFCRGRIFDYCEHDNGQYDDNVEIFWASGCAFFVRTRVFHEMGGFDPFFFAHQEEIDLCWRMQLSNYRIFVCPKSLVYHVGGGTLPKGNTLKVFLNFRNNLIMLYKNYYRGERLWKIPYRLLLDLVSALKNVFIGQETYVRAVIKAHWGFFGWWFRHRKQGLFPKKKMHKPDTIYPGNIVWKHFIQGKKTYSDIKASKK
jgi:GT2 family glycosyltransferase